MEAWERSWDRSIAHGPTRRLLCQSQRGGTPDAGPAFSGTASRGRCGSCTLSRKKRERREVLWIFGPSRDRGLCRRRRPIQPAGLGPLRVSSVPAHKIGKRLFLCVVPLPASSPSPPTPMGRCRPFTPPLSLLVLFLATPSLTAPFQRDQKAVNSSGRSLGPHPPNAPTASSPPRPPSSACSSRLDRQGTAPKNSDGG